MVKKILNNIVNNPAIGLSIIVLCTVLVYSNTFKNEFLVDDYLFIVDWPLIRDLGSFPEFFGPENQPKGEEGVYSPLKTCFHAFNYHLWGQNPFGYHLVALLIHLIGAFFVYQISFLLSSNRAIAFISGFLFGLHPVHVEAVTFLTASIDTLGVVFLFISFYFYIRSQKDTDCNCIFYICSLFFALLAIFTHELAIILPILFLLYDFCFKTRKAPSSKIFLKIAPYFIFALIYVMLKVVILGSVARGTYLYGSFYLTMLVIIKAWAKYVFICFWPLQLSLNSEISKGIFSVDWQYFDRQAVLSQSIYDMQVVMALLFTGAVIYLAIRIWKRNPIITFCIGWFYISLLPVSNIVPSESYFAERYLYPGTLGFCLILAYILFQMYAYGSSYKRVFKFISVSLAVGILVFYSFRTIARNQDWNNETAFLEAEVRVNPYHPGMRRDLGIIYLRSGQHLKALDALKAAVALMDSDEDAYFALGEVHTDLEDYRSAINSYLKAIKISPEFPEAYYNVAEVYNRSGRKQESRIYLRTAIELYQKQEKWQEAQTAQWVLKKYLGEGK